MLEAKINEFINSYAEAVMKIDIEAIASHFNDQFVLSTQKNYWFITNNDEFKLNLEKSFSGYKKLGANLCSMLNFNIIDFQSNHCIANIKWGLFDNNSNLLINFDISYCIKEINSAFKYVFVIDHNETECIEEYLRNK